MFIPGPASAPLDRTTTHPRLPLSADPALAQLFKGRCQSLSWLKCYLQKPVSELKATTHYSATLSIGTSSYLSARIQSPYGISALAQKYTPQSI
ncbi:hypothetical protein BASA60_006027 [Batrachochytrium salamandrivorans]|nr:hypothetical protein BASA60_006027 [Batrachochytrium salamandrivorans]